MVPFGPAINASESSFSSQLLERENTHQFPQPELPAPNPVRVAILGGDPRARERIRQLLEHQAEVEVVTAWVFSESELREYLSRLAEALHPKPRHVVVKSGLRTLLVRTADIHWIESAGNYVRIHHHSGSHLLRETMASIATKLPQNQFARVRRGTIVNLDRVVEIRQRGAGQHFVLLQEGKEFSISRVFRAKMEQTLSLF